MPNYEKAIRLLEESQNIAVFMHINPDGDCISSAIALYLFLKKRGKNVVCFSQNRDSSFLPSKFNFLPSFEVINAENPQKSYDLSVGVDIADAGRLGEYCFRLYMKGKKNLIIDHHLCEKEFAQYSVRSTVDAATTQILYKIFTEYDKNLIDKDIATCLYTGLVTDTGCFSFPSTTNETHYIASELLKYGIDSDFIIRRVMKDIALNVFNLKNRVLSKAEFFDEGSIGLISFMQEDFEVTDTTEKDTEGIINSIIDIKGVEVAIALSEISAKSYKVSFRTKHSVDAQACARCFGGGGHFHASGCRIYGYYEDVKEKLISAVREIISYA